MSIEAMKQALKALERGRPQIVGVLVQQDQDAAITVLRAAIEQVEKQEPVAHQWKGELFTPGEIEVLGVTDAVPLYKHPRQWVGLTAAELQAIDDSFRLRNTVGLTDYYRAIEQALKEKNA